MCRDPVCGAEMDSETTSWTVRYLEQMYYFCCENCLQVFTQNPQRYIQSDRVHALVGSMIGLS
ncbi:MAG TPA: YHS domain-containing protein [Capsulimonadaceae bacterium]|nr:YHS domain-containing protein [Capsulimonadaceae bacterium]